MLNCLNYWDSPIRCQGTNKVTIGKRNHTIVRCRCIISTTVFLHEATLKCSYFLW